ncbi:MAG: hypothetical protein KDA41_04575 [Planctomycetales bacterium]|nr:hypothetical protein [Planctomycetales bacterium]
MKRQQLAEPSSFTPVLDRWEEANAGCLSSHEDPQNHSLFVPLHYERNYAYPLIVWLHGEGDNERQLKRVMPLLSLRNYVAIAPRGTSRAAAEGAYCWRQTPGDIVEAQWRVECAIEHAAKSCNVHPRRVFLGGFGDGGTMALRLALRSPDRFGGVFSIGGSLPAEHSPLINLHAVRGLRTLFCLGQQGQSCQEDLLCRDLRLLHLANAKAEVRLYPCGDELTTQMLSDLDGWLMEQVTGCPAESSAEAISVNSSEWN